MKKLISYLLVAVIAVSLVVVGISCSEEDRLYMATTTSLYDTGLWDYLEPMFEEEYSVDLDVIYAGTGIALEYGMRGDVDVITVHAKSREEQFVADGYGVERVPFAYNYFVVVGPAEDPAGIKGMMPEDAFTQLFETGNASFVSRGDDSGTHGKEKAIWTSAGYEFEDITGSGAWYVEAGSGMGPTLVMASEKQAYTLSDIGTFLAYKGDIDLVTIVDSGSILLNVYSVIACNPTTNSNVYYEMAENLVDFLTSNEIQELIGNYGTNQYGEGLFKPCVANEPTS